LAHRSIASEDSRSDCLFCKIVAGKLDAAIVYEDDDFIGFLDIMPLFSGHVLFCPRKHFETFPDVPAELVGPMFLKSQLLTRAVETAASAEGTFLAINNRVSQTVPHLHLHIVPRRRRDGLKGFFWPRHKYPEPAAMEEARSAVAKEMERLISQSGK
jgi:histidine triad (HIT) family protein